MGAVFGVGALVLVLVLAGCNPFGGDLADEDRYDVTTAGGAITSYCLSVTLEATGAERETPERDYSALLDGIDTLTRIYRDNPDATYESGDKKRTMREVVADAVNTLEDCEPEEARELDRVLEAS